MRTIILRDDDTNALTPVECLERLYRPFLDRGMPVHLATVPEVRVDARTPDGRLEGFVLPGMGTGHKPGATIPLTDNRGLIDYLRANPGYHIAQHGCYHDTFEFDSRDRSEVARRLDHGRQRLREAGFDDVRTFVAPHDKLSPVAYREVVKRFSVISTGWFEWNRLPPAWRWRYFFVKLRRRMHWQVGRTLLVRHPGCLLSYQRPYDRIIESIKYNLRWDPVTVLVTHWWEYFRDGKPDEAFIRVLHETADFLASQPDIQVITFDALAQKAGLIPPSPIVSPSVAKAAAAAAVGVSY